MTTRARIGILVGSVRVHGNAAGLTAWLDIVVIDRNTDPFPLPPIEGAMAAAVRPPEFNYASNKVREWSQLVRCLDGLLVLTPQHNWGIPSSLKLALDHIYHEWKGKPVAVVTYGGHGGGKCAEQLESVLKGGLKMDLVSCGECAIALPKDYIGGDSRVGDADQNGFLAEYNGKLDGVLDALLEGIIAKAKTSKS